MSWKNLDDNEVLNFDELTIKSGKKVEILGIKIDNNLYFNNHIKSIYWKASQKLNALLRISSNLNMKQKRLSYKKKKKKKKLYGPFSWMGFNCLKARATSRRQFAFYHQAPTISLPLIVL